MGQDHRHDHEVNQKSMEGILGSCPNVWYKICSRAWSHYSFAKASETMKVSSICYTARQDTIPSVKWLILGSKLPERVVPDHPIDSLAVRVT